MGVGSVMGHKIILILGTAVVLGEEMHCHKTRVSYFGENSSGLECWREVCIGPKREVSGANRPACSAALLAV